jgi:hypothetical protein
MSVSPACPNCAWAIRVSRERKLPATARWVFTNIAELVNRHTLEFSGKSCIAILADYTGLNRRTIQFALKKIPSDLVSITAGAGTHYVFKLLRPQSPIYESDSQETTNQIRSDPETTNQIRSAYESDSQQVAPDYESDSQNPLSKNPLKNPQESPPLTPPPGGSRAPGRAESEHPRFAEFYGACHRKQGRRHASKAFTAALNRGADPDDIIAAMRQQTPNPNPRYRKLPATWLNGDCWKDEAPPSRDERLLEIVGLKPSWSFEDPPPPPARPSIGRFVS